MTAVGTSPPVDDVSANPFACAGPVISLIVVATRSGGQKRYRLVSAEEHALVGDGCSTSGPIGSVLLGAGVGDVREITLPRGAEELVVLALEGEPP